MRISFLVIRPVVFIDDLIWTKVSVRCPVTSSFDQVLDDVEPAMIA